MTNEEIINIFANSRLQSEYFTKEALTAAYVEALSALRAQQASTEALTLDELRGMDGEPVFVADGLNSWGIVIVDNSGYWKGSPFVQGNRFNYNAEMRGLHCYRAKPKEEQA